MTRKEVIGDAELWLGDCREILPTIGAVDAVVTDPPYFGREDLFPTDAVLEVMAYVESIKTRAVFWPCYGADPVKSDAIHVWHKSVPIHPNSVTGNVPGHQYERIFTAGMGARGTVIRAAAIMPNFAACADEVCAHPTQKPLAVVGDFVAKCKGTILDPFMGSGTTGVACARLGRRFIGIEIEPKYFDIACRRIEQAQRQKDLFINAPVAEPPEDARLADLFAEPEA